MNISVVADLIVVLHFGFILFVVMGGLLVLKWPKAALAHIPCALWGIMITLGGWICPLTPLEQNLRLLAGQAGYSGGFVAYYILPLIYPSGLTRGIQVLLGSILLVFNAVVYWRVVVNRRRRRRD